jgi:3-hydroxy acid dehydrogenase / malonic semialdehyde reductase
MFNLKHKIVFITGASSGIGAECAEAFAKEGAKLLLCARRLPRVEKLAAQLQDRYGTETHIFDLDVRNRNAVIAQIAALPKAWQSIDILLNNAGLALGLHKLHEAEIDDWEQMIDTNVKGLLFVTRTVLPEMVRRNTGHIINIGSVAGHDIYSHGNVYCATKHAVDVITRSLRVDLAGTNIRVSTVDPGMVDTEFSEVRFKGDKERAKKVYAGMQPLLASDIADAVLYCASRPPHVNISEIIIWPTAQASVSVVTRS